MLDCAPLSVCRHALLKIALHLNLLYVAIQQSLLSRLKGAPSGVACMLSTSFKTNCMVQVVQMQQDIPVVWVVAHSGTLSHG